MSSPNRRRAKRLKIHKSVRIPVHMFSSKSKSGRPLQAHSLNISPGGIALRIPIDSNSDQFKRGKTIKINIRIPGAPFVQCQGVICHMTETTQMDLILGIRFAKLPKDVQELLIKMSMDNESCDRRIQESSNPWCSRTCGYYHLCRKPIRTPEPDPLVTAPFEITF